MDTVVPNELETLDIHDLRSPDIREVIRIPSENASIRGHESPLDDTMLSVDDWKREVAAISIPKLLQWIESQTSFRLEPTAVDVRKPRLTVR